MGSASSVPASVTGSVTPPAHCPIPPAVWKWHGYSSCPICSGSAEQHPSNMPLPTARIPRAIDPSQLARILKHKSQAPCVSREVIETLSKEQRCRICHRWPREHRRGRTSTTDTFVDIVCPVPHAVLRWNQKDSCPYCLLSSASKPTNESQTIVRDESEVSVATTLQVASRPKHPEYTICLARPDIERYFACRSGVCPVCAHDHDDHLYLDAQLDRAMWNLQARKKPRVRVSGYDAFIQSTARLLVSAAEMLTPRKRNE
jgi:hypothetical protein